MSVLSLFPAALAQKTTSKYDRLTYQQLFTIDAEQLDALMRPRLKRIRQTADPQQKKEWSKDALATILTHPQSLGFRSQFVSRVRSSLEDDTVFINAMLEVGDDSIKELQKRALTKESWMTNITILENLMLEIKPARKTEARFQKLIERVRDAKLELPPPLEKVFLRQQMQELRSPSETARLILVEDKKDTKK